MSAAWENIQESLSQLPVKKLRLELIVNELLRQGVVKKENLVIVPEPSSLYNFEADASLQDQTTDYWEITTPQVSFYDRLPEPLFHKYVRPTTDDDKFQLIRREEEKQEQAGRQFFLPFDNRLYHYRTAIEKVEEEGLTGSNTSLLRQLIALLWTPDFPTELLADHQLVNVVKLLSVLHRVAGKLSLCETYLSDIIGLPVSIKIRDIALPVDANTANFAGVGDLILGTNSTLLGDQIETTYAVIQATIGPVAEQRILDFLPTGKWRRLIEALLDLILPVEADYCIELLTERTKDIWQRDLHNSAGRLGYTTYI